MTQTIEHPETEGSGDSGAERKSRHTKQLWNEFRISGIRVTEQQQPVYTPRIKTQVLFKSRFSLQNKEGPDRAAPTRLTRRSTPSFEMHHTQRISLAAVMADAKAIRRRLLALKHSSSLSSRLRLLLSRRIGLSRPSTPVPPGGPARVRRNVMFSLAFAP